MRSNHSQAVANHLATLPPTFNETVVLIRGATSKWRKSIGSFKKNLGVHPRGDYLYAMGKEKNFGWGFVVFLFVAGVVGLMVSVK